MPQVPRYSEPQVQESARPAIQRDASLPLDAFGGGQSAQNVTNAVGNIADIGMKIAAAEKQKADQVVLEDAKAKLSDFELKYQYDPQTGAMNKHGKDAFNLKNELDESWKKVTGDIEKNLTNDSQRLAFKQVSQSYYNSINKNIQSHVAGETQQFDTDTTNSLIVNERRNAALNYKDPQRIQESLYRQGAAFYNYATRYGKGDEWAKEKINTAISDTHFDVMEKMIANGEIENAKKHYAENKDLLIGDQAIKFPEYINQHEKRLEAEQKAQKELVYDNNMRRTMIDMFDGNLTLSELERRYRADILKKSDYDLMEGKLVKPEYQLLREIQSSDNTVFTAIRQAQLEGTRSPGDISRLIANGVVNNKLTKDDGKYLDKMTKEIPPDPRDQEVLAQGQAVEDFGKRYFSETVGDYLPVKVPVVSNINVNTEKTVNNAKNLKAEFYKRVDKENAHGERINEIAHEVMHQFVKKEHPEVNRLSDIPHIIVGIDGKIQRLIEPGQQTKLKGQYKIIKNTTEDTPQPPKKSGNK